MSSASSSSCNCLLTNYNVVNQKSSIEEYLNCDEALKTAFINIDSHIVHNILNMDILEADNEIDSEIDESND